jgi:hypothetical protein
MRVVRQPEIILRRPDGITAQRLQGEGGEKKSALPDSDSLRHRPTANGQPTKCRKKFLVVLSPPLHALPVLPLHPLPLLSHFLSTLTPPNHLKMSSLHLHDELSGHAVPYAPFNSRRSVVYGAFAVPSPTRFAISPRRDSGRAAGSHSDV